MSNGDNLVREQQANYPDEPFKPWPLGDAEVQMMVSPKVREKIVAMLLEREETAFRAGQAAMQFRAAEECRIRSLPILWADREDDFVREFAQRVSQDILGLPLLESSDPRTFTELREQRIVQEQMKQAAGLAVEATVNAEAGGGPRFRIDPTNKDDFARGHRVIREVETMTPVCLAYGKEAADAILLRLNAFNYYDYSTLKSDLASVLFDYASAGEGYLAAEDESSSPLLAAYRRLCEFAGVKP